MKNSKRKEKKMNNETNQEVTTAATDVIGMSVEEKKELISFYVKEVYGNYGAKVKVIKDDESDGMWIAFLPDKKVTLYAHPDLDEVYQLAFDEYEGFILYGSKVSSNQFDPMEMN